MNPKSIKTGLLSVAALLTFGSTPVLAKDIIHDAEHYILAAQHGEKWAAEDLARRRVVEHRFDLKESGGGTDDGCFARRRGDEHRSGLCCVQACLGTWGGSMTAVKSV